MPVGTIWTLEEDERLSQLVSIHGPKKWSQIASDLGTKGSKQCRRRWKNFISLEERKQGSWTPQEDAMLLDGHRRHGNKWTLIAQEIGGRTDNAVKNRWAALEKKRRADEEPGELSRRHMPVMRSQNDLLGVRRIICKDQPHYRAPQMAESGWMEELRQDDQQPPQLAYTLSPGLVMHQHIHQTDNNQLNSMSTRKPDLMINIPGIAAAEPELPYSQRSRGNAAFAGQKDLQGMELAPVQIRADDESLLNASRQAAQNTLTALTSPSEEPGAINSLYKYLCSATPVDTQQQLPTGQQSPPPWVSSNRAMDPQHQQLVPPPQMQQHLLPPPLLLQSQLPPLHQQQQQQQLPQFQQQPETGGMMVPPQPQLPTIQLQPNTLQQQQQHAPSIPVSSGMVPCQQQVISCMGAQTGPGYVLPATAGMQVRQHTRHGSMLAPIAMVQQQQMLAQQMRYPPAWQPPLPPPPQQQQQAYSNPGVAQSQGQYMQPAMSSAMCTDYPLQYLQQQQQLQQPDDVQKQWGPEELRQLLDLLGDQQQPGQGEGQLPAVACLPGSADKLQPHGSVPGSAGMSPHVPEEEVEQVNNGHGRCMHAMPQADMGLTRPQPGTNYYQLL